MKSSHLLSLFLCLGLVTPTLAQGLGGVTDRGNQRADERESEGSDKADNGITDRLKGESDGVTAGSTASGDNFDLGGEPLFTSAGGEGLLQSVQRDFKPARTLGYKRARRAMYNDIDNVNGKLFLVYTGVWVPANGGSYNCEHTFPQSKFSKASAPKSDIHHLFATNMRANSSRSSFPFMELDDDEDTNKWWGPITKGGGYQTGKPAGDQIDEFSESGGGGFEPREAHKGNVARAMLYVYAIYTGRAPVNTGWFLPQLPTLVRWNAVDPVDADEVRRTQAIERYQGNVNPFVSDPSLFDRYVQALLDAGRLNGNLEREVETALADARDPIPSRPRPRPRPPVNDGGDDSRDDDQADRPTPPPTGVELEGSVSAIDGRHGNVTTDIDGQALTEAGLRPGHEVVVEINGVSLTVQVARGFFDVPRHELLVTNNRGRLTLAINRGNFARQYGVQAGMSVTIRSK